MGYYIWEQVGKARFVGYSWDVELSYIESLNFVAVSHGFW